jgi:hypothetical protein
MVDESEGADIFTGKKIENEIQETSSNEKVHNNAKINRAVVA